MRERGKKRSINGTLKYILLVMCAVGLYSPTAFASDTVQHQKVVIEQRIAAQIAPSYVFQSNRFLRGVNHQRVPINTALAGQVGYAFGYNSQSAVGQIFGNPYQGVGVAKFTFFNASEMGNPWAFYLFQGARLAQFSSRLSLHYEWRFGISSGWKPYNEVSNPMNVGVGTARNAYINAGVALHLQLSSQFDFISGLSVSHFSNGNTKFPNAGVNTGDVYMGLVYYLDRQAPNPDAQQSVYIPTFKRFISYDLALFGAWRRKGVTYKDGIILSPRAYPVVGFRFAPMYNFCYRLRAGVSLDGTYDGSSDVSLVIDNTAVVAGIYGGVNGSTGQSNVEFFDGPVGHRLSLGLSLCAEYVMPYLSIHAGIGHNFLYSKGDMRGFYQMLNLKISVSRLLYLNIGYNLQNFNTPNYLMLGFGLRFHNQYPRLKFN